MMRWTQYINEHEVRKAIAILKNSNELFECRILDGNRKSKTLSGYFTSADELLKQFDTVDVRGKNIYITLNEIDESCYSRFQHDKFLQADTTTTDKDITAYKWLFIDLDPVRASGISSSNAELKAAEDMAREIVSYLTGLGFENPVKALSGNGCHLLYRISLEKNKENCLLVQECLQTLSMIFDNDQVKVDKTNSNPSRICKLHGTLAQKGTSTEDRPHRFSRIFTDSTDVKVNKKMFLEKLVAQLPRQEQSQSRQYQQYYHDNSQFNVEDFMREHGMTYKEQQGDRARIFRLDECPFDSNHKNGDAKIFLYPNGAIAFKCHHNSCADKHWQDVRLLYEPDAYDQSDIDNHIEEGYAKHNRLKQEGKIQYSPMVETEPDIADVKAFRTAIEILADQEPEHEMIRCGVDTIDERAGGLEKQCITVVTGLSGCGKTTFLGNIMLRAINDGHSVVCYSGEMSNRKYLDWMIRQAAGKTNIEIGTQYRNGYGVRKEVQDKIAFWMGDHFHLYDNKIGRRFKTVAGFLKKELQSTKADLCVIDNMMSLGVGSMNGNQKYDEQTEFVWWLKEMAQLSNTHIIFVAHPRKASGFLRLTDISGTADIGNTVDSAFILHRVNQNFRNGYKEFFKCDYDPKDESKATNLIEVAKDRDGDSGLQDTFINLYFEENTKRLLNAPDEYVRYGWDTEASAINELSERDMPF